MRNMRKVFKLLVINVVIFLVLLELVSVAIYYFKNNAFFYFHEREPQQLIEFNVDRQLTNNRFHPFFGYTLKPGMTNTNNYGFVCQYDYPYNRNHEDCYIVGIFGGSVANGFYLEGRERLKKRLLGLPLLKDKEIVFLNYAMGGYKQPHQIQILTFFLAIGQQLDMVINIDGFNETVFCPNNNRLNVDMAMPSAQHYLPMRDLIDTQSVTRNKLESLWKIQNSKKDYNRNLKKLEATPFASVYLILNSYNSYIYKKYRSETLRFDSLFKPGKLEDSLVNVKYTPGLKNESLLFTEIARFWSKCSLMMNQVLSANKVEYYHFLQPNQYHSNKTFTKSENKTALNMELPYSYLVRKGYPVLLKQVKILQGKNVKAFSAIDIFKDRKETIYIDTCCHFNKLGNEILADYIFEGIKNRFPKSKI
jgi:hypothetical protein